MTDLIDSPQLEEKLSRKEIEKCNNLAKEFLDVDDSDLKNKKIIHSLNSVYYKEEESTGALLVCKDGSVLFADREYVSFPVHKKAFEGGLRSSKEILKDRKGEIIALDK